MATLNADETEALRKAKALIEEIQRHGYDPALVKRPVTSIQSPEARAKHIARELEIARRRLHTIVTMKGYYPK